MWIWRLKDSTCTACLCTKTAFTLSLSIASSPPGVDMMRSWMLVTDCKPTWLASEPEDGEAVREPRGAVEKWPGRWFSEAIKYLFLLFWKSLRSKPMAGEREGERKDITQKEDGWKNKITWNGRTKCQIGGGERKGCGEIRTRGREDQCKHIHIVGCRVKKNIPVRWLILRSSFHPI